jgi:hypothetical protein
MASLMVLLDRLQRRCHLAHSAIANQDQRIYLDYRNFGHVPGQGADSDRSARRSEAAGRPGRDQEYRDNVPGVRITFTL